MVNLSALSFEEIRELNNSELSVSELEAKKARLLYAHIREYSSRGNTPRCSKLYQEIREVEEEIEKRK